jgi:TonB family protein
MLRRLVTAAALTVAVSGAAAAQAAGDFQTIRDWDAGDRASTEPSADTLRLREGYIWSPRGYGDFVLRFEYRPLSPAGRGTLHLRATLHADGGLSSYEVALDRSARRGRLDASGQSLHELPFTASAPVDDPTAWIAAEVRARGDRLSVVLDGVPVAAADRSEAFFGTVGFEAAKGGLELRGLQVALLSVPARFDPALPRAADAGITAPGVVRKAYPQYTRAAMQARAQGVARVEFVIDAEGAPGEIRVIEAPHPDLARTAVDCVRRWRFTPAVKDGVPVAVVATMDLSFKLK